MPKTRKSSDKIKAETDEPKISLLSEPEVEKAPAKAVKAVFVPVGYVKVHVETPSGNEYNLVPREVFTIAAEDVDWFFTTWDWSFRQRLCLVSDYKPTCGYHDPKVGEKDYRPQIKYDPIPTRAAKPIDSSTATAVETNSEEKE